MISLKKGHEIHNFTNNYLFSHNALWQRLAVQDVCMQNDIAHRLSPSEVSWQIMVQDVTVKRLCFLTLGSPIIQRIHSSSLKRQRDLDIRIPNNLMDTFILSKKTKRSVLKAEWGKAEPSWSFAELSSVWKKRTGQRQNRAGQDRAGSGQKRLLSSTLVPLISHQSFSTAYLSNKSAFFCLA